MFSQLAGTVFVPITVIFLAAHKLVERKKKQNTEIKYLEASGFGWLKYHFTFDWLAMIYACWFHTIIITT